MIEWLYIARWINEIRLLNEFWVAQQCLSNTGVTKNLIADQYLRMDASVVQTGKENQDGT